MNKLAKTLSPRADQFRKRFMTDVEFAELTRQIDEAGHLILALLRSALRRRGAAHTLQQNQEECPSTKRLTLLSPERSL
jgi:hypothetical protein